MFTTHERSSSLLVRGIERGVVLSIEGRYVHR